MRAALSASIARPKNPACDVTLERDATRSRIRTTTRCSGIDSDATFRHLQPLRLDLAPQLSKHEHLATRFGRIEQFALRRPMAQDCALVDVGFVGNLSRRQRGGIFEQGKGADA